MKNENLLQAIFDAVVTGLTLGCFLAAILIYFGAFPCH